MFDFIESKPKCIYTAQIEYRVENQGGESAEIATFTAEMTYRKTRVLLSKELQRTL